MKKDYSVQDMKRILKQDIKIPDTIEKQIQDTYKSLGMKGNVTMRYAKGHRTRIAVAAIAALVAGMSIVTFAANKFLSANLVSKEDSVQYRFQVDKAQEAHQIKVEPNYIPQGYASEDGEDSYVGKWHNDKTGGWLSIIPYNASELDKLERTGGAEFMKYPKDTHVKELEINGMKTDVFVNKSFYKDSDNTLKSLFLFNEQYGYGVQVIAENTLEADEIIKVAKGLRIETLDETVPYVSDEELAQEKADREKQTEQSIEDFKAGISAKNVFETGSKIKNPFYADAGKNDGTLDDIRYTVEDVSISDSLPAAEFDVKNFISYDQLKPWILENGALKPHDRYKSIIDENGMDTGERKLENVASKFVVVKMKAKNCGETQSKQNQQDGIEIAPDLTVLSKRSDGNYSLPPYTLQAANEGYELQWFSNGGSSFPIYFDKMYFSKGEERQKHSLYVPLKASEELEYTLVYVADEDQIDQLYLSFFMGQGSVSDASYVKIDK